MNARHPDRPVENAWRATLSVLIFAFACATVMLLQAAFFAGVDRQWAAAGLYFTVASALGTALGWICYNRSELCDSY